MASALMRSVLVSVPDQVPKNASKMAASRREDLSSQLERVVEGDQMEGTVVGHNSTVLELFADAGVFARCRGTGYV